MNRPSKISLANLPTPIQLKCFEGKEFLIKRDDFTGIELSGNKVRKLEYLLKQAIDEHSNIVFTTGGEQSNHSRATAIACAQVGLKSKLFLWGKDSSKPVGNLFLDKVVGTKIRYLSKEEFSHTEKIMAKEQALLAKKGLKVFIIPEGGSSTLGIWGYITFFEEIKKQINISNLEGIWGACGSGGTAAGLLVGAALNNLNIKIYAVNVLYPKDFIFERIIELADKCITEFNLNCKINIDNLIVVDGYSNEGYKKILQEKVKVLVKFARSNGIILDPAYTGKAFYAYNDFILSKNLGKKVIFLHTGGIYGVFCKAVQYLI